MLENANELPDLLESFSIILSLNKKARKTVYKSIHELRLNFDEEYARYIRDLSESEKKDISTSEQLIMYKKLMKYYEKKILTKNIYPLNDLFEIHVSNYPGKGRSPFNEFKEFYFTGDDLGVLTKERRKEIALNDLLYETPIEEIDSEELEKKLDYSLNEGRAYSGTRNYMRMLKNAFSQFFNGNPAYLAGIVYVLTNNKR